MAILFLPPTFIPRSNTTYFFIGPVYKEAANHNQRIMHIMTIIDEYVATLKGKEKAIIEHMNDVVRKMVPDATEEVFYGMPSFKYRDKGLISILATKKFLSLYPYCAVERLGLDLSAHEGTKGSVHFTPEKPISDELLRDILSARMRMIEG